MIFEEEFKEITSSNEFIKFKEKNPLSFLSGVFILGTNFQFDFYNPENEKIGSFTFIGNDIKTEESDVFKKENNKVKQLNLDKVKINLNNIKKLMSSLLDKYNQKSNREITILQQDEFPIWNVSYLTEQFKLLHVKINAINGKIIEEKLENIMSFKV